MAKKNKMNAEQECVNLLLPFMLGHENVINNNKRNNKLHYNYCGVLRAWAASGATVLRELYDSNCKPKASPLKTLEDCSFQASGGSPWKEQKPVIIPKPGSIRWIFQLLNKRLLRWNLHLPVCPCLVKLWSSGQGKEVGVASLHVLDFMLEI